jgi:hypothetical protein
LRLEDGLQAAPAHVAQVVEAKNSHLTRQLREVAPKVRPDRKAISGALKGRVHFKRPRVAKFGKCAVDKKSQRRNAGDVGAVRDVVAPPRARADAKGHRDVARAHLNAAADKAVIARLFDHDRIFVRQIADDAEGGRVMAASGDAVAKRVAGGEGEI